jgi:glutaredoxin-like YruB-family protein
MDVKIYTTPTCGYCHQAKRYLDELGVSYKEYDVSRDRAAAEEMVKFTGQMGVPVIVVNGEAIIGFNQTRLQQLLAGANNGKRPRIGLKVTDAGRIARKKGEPPVFGAAVGSVAPSSPGEHAGIRAGDIITSVNNKRINNVAELEEVLGKLTAGSSVSVTFYRGEKAIKSEITV